MPFQLSPEQEAIRQAVREFGDEEVRPVAMEYEAEHRYPTELLAEAASLDLVAPHVPEGYGGAGMDAISTVVVTEECGGPTPASAAPSPPRTSALGCSSSTATSG